MIRSTLATLLALSSLSALAQMTPVGLWQTISDVDGKPAAEVRVIETGGVITAVVEKALRQSGALKQSGEPNCDKCPDDRKGKPKVGLQIIRELKKTEGKDVWEGGNIIDPDSGTIYKAKLTPIDGGKKLEVRAFVGVALLGRTQTWLRVQ